MNEELNSNIGEVVGIKKKKKSFLCKKKKKVRVLRDQEGLILASSFIKRFEELGA